MGSLSLLLPQAAVKRAGSNKPSVRIVLMVFSLSVWTFGWTFFSCDCT
jgi:hypothetical protein